MGFKIISAMDLNRGIGKNNALSWDLKADMKHFKELTSEGTVIMGRKTWESLPEAYRPLPNRENIVLSRTDFALPKDVILAKSLDEALNFASKEKIYVIGGATIYTEAILHPECEGMSITLINSVFDCDAFFPEIPANMMQSSSSPFQEENGLEFAFLEFSAL